MDSGKVTAVDADVYANDGYAPELAFIVSITILKLRLRNVVCSFAFSFIHRIYVR